MDTENLVSGPGSANLTFKQTSATRFSCDHGRLAYNHCRFTYNQIIACRFAITREEQERHMSEEMIKMREFREDMPVEEGVIIGKLLKSIDRIIEMELTLTESRQHDEVTLKDLQNISDFIVRQVGRVRE